MHPLSSIPDDQRAACASHPFKKPAPPHKSQKSLKRRTCAYGEEVFLNKKHKSESQKRITGKVTSLSISKPAIQEIGEVSFGPKHKNLVKIIEFLTEKGISTVSVPLLHGVSSNQVEGFLRQYAPEVFTDWEQLQKIYLEHPSKSSFLQLPKVMEILNHMDKNMSHAFALAELNFQEIFPFSSQLLDLIKKLKEKGSYLMVRSSGAEDSQEVVNAGGNASESYVDPHYQAIVRAIGIVVGSYFKPQSLQNRILAGQNPFAEPLQLAVAIQELVGEQINGGKTKEEVPISFVLYTNQTLGMEGQKGVIRTLSMTWGHGEAVVKNEAGIACDWVIMTPSDSDPKEANFFVDVRVKEHRLAPIRKQKIVQLDRLSNPMEWRQQPALNQAQLQAVYQAANLIDQIFKMPMDVEGAVKGQQVYLFQARPIKQPPSLPRYFNFNLAQKQHPTAIADHLQGETIVCGKATALILHQKQALFDNLLRKAESRFQREHQAVLFTEEEPRNSHSVTNLTHAGIPCLRLPNSIKQLLTKVDEQFRLIVCPQSASIIRWNESIAAANPYITPGFAFFPLPVGVSITPSFITKHRRAIILEKELQTIRTNLYFIRMGTKEQALQALNDLWKFPLLQKLGKESKNLQEIISQEPAILPSIQLGHETLQQFFNNLKKAFIEMEACLQTKTDSNQIKRLLRAKVLENLLLPVPQVEGSIGKYCLLDMEPLLASLHHLIQYQRATRQFSGCTLDTLLLYGSQAPSPHLFKKWAKFLLDLEDLNFHKKISTLQIIQFKELITTLASNGCLASWLTFYFAPASIQQNALYQFTEILQNHPPQDAFMANLGTSQKQLQKIAAQVEDFGYPARFENALTQLTAEAHRWSSKEQLNHYKQANMTMKIMSHQVMESLVNLFDTACKTIKTSPHFPSEKDQVKSLRASLKPFLRLLASWAENLIREENLPLYKKLDYLSFLRRRLLSGSDEHARQLLLATPGFSAMAAMLLSSTNSERHLPITLEDLLTTIHQSLLAILVRLNGKILSQELIKQAALPSPLKSMMADAAEFLKNHDTDLVGINVSTDQIVVQYNVPLRCHSARLAIGYDRQLQDYFIEGQILGKNEMERWNILGHSLGALHAGEILTLKRPVFINDQEMNFVWHSVTLKNFQAALRTWESLLTFSSDYGEDSKEIWTYMNDLNDHLKYTPEQMKKMAGYFLQRQLPYGEIFYKHYLTHLTQQELEEAPIKDLAPLLLLVEIKPLLSFHYSNEESLQ